MGPITTLDFQILDWIQANLRCIVGDVLFPVITMFGNAGVFWITLTLALAIFPKTRKVAAGMAIALILCGVVGNLTLKPLISRLRPFYTNMNIELLIPMPSDYSFPSGHTMSSFAAAVAIWCRHKKWGVAAIVFAALIAFSRLYLYVHYPSDVLAGLILGVAFGLMGPRIADGIWRRIQTRRQAGNKEERP